MKIRKIFKQDEWIRI